MDLAWYYYCMKNNCFSQTISGSSALLRAHGSGGASATINKLAPQKNFRAKPKQAGEKEGGLGEGIFARLLSLPAARLGWGSTQIRLRIFLEKSSDFVYRCNLNIF